MRPLWVDVQDSAYPAVDHDIEVDIAIIGGGLSGTGAAWALRDRGLKVALLEERTIGSGASGRNGGFVLAGPAMSFNAAVMACGADGASEIWQLTLQNNATMAQLVRDLTINCGFLRRGSMSLAVSVEEMEILEQSHDELRRAGISTCVVPADGLPVPFDTMYVGGIYYPGNGEMNSGMFARGVAGALGNDVQVFEQSPVTELSYQGVWTLATPGGTVRAGAVVLATNAYTPRLLPSVPIAPTRGQVVATVRLDRVVVPFPMYANYGYQYWRQTADGRFVVGGWRDLDIASEIGTEERFHDGIQDALVDFTRAVVGPQAQIEYRWAGIMGFTPDQFPLVGAVPGSDGLFLAAGYSGHGVSMAFTCGGVAAAMAVGDSVSLPATFAPARLLQPA